MSISALLWRPLSRTTIEAWVVVSSMAVRPFSHWDETLRPLTGHDPRVRDYVLEQAVG